MQFAFDANRHEYIDLERREVVPHITGMLEETGWVDTRWYTEEGSDRGHAVHQLTADFDLGAIADITALQSPYKSYLLGHVVAMSIIRPTWRYVEQPFVSRAHRYAGRPDRAGAIYRAEGVLEIKSGAPARADRIQTALQAILVAEELQLPPASLVRFGLYLNERGRFKLEQFVDRRDFDIAYRIIQQCCGGPL